MVDGRWALASALSRHLPLGIMLLLMIMIERGKSVREGRNRSGLWNDGTTQRSSLQKANRGAAP